MKLYLMLILCLYILEFGLLTAILSLLFIMVAFVKREMSKKVYMFIQEVIIHTKEYKNSNPFFHTQEINRNMISYWNNLRMRGLRLHSCLLKPLLVSFSCKAVVPNHFPRHRIDGMLILDLRWVERELRVWKVNWSI